ncbi:MAG: DUF1905 domain-containing protein [Chloroflexi bacterium]|nr:MAG: DUF1905 domain-containing protein [Chloroflexota bacterium]
MPALQFDGRLESDQGACFIRVPPQTLTALGPGKRAPVKVTINGFTYRTTIAVYGGKSYVGVRREVREAAGVAAGDPITVGLEYDAQVRTVDLPQALRVALEADPAIAAAFEKLSHTRQKEFVQWVTGAKRADTQRRRMEQALAMLRPRPGRR